MIGIVGLAALITVLALSLFITQVASIALAQTGLSHEAARFQARSAFTGTGFTTSEAEKVVDHPVRRRIIMLLMVVRSAGLVSIIISVILSFGADMEPGFGRLYRLAFLVVAVLVLLALARSRWIRRALARAIQWALHRWTELDTRDYVSLLKLQEDYSIQEQRIGEDDWLTGLTLQEAELLGEGVTVLGVMREDGTYIGAPQGETQLYPGDSLTLYGRADTLHDLDSRGAGSEGEQAHDRAVEKQRAHVAREQQEDAEYEERRGSD